MKKIKNLAGIARSIYHYQNRSVHLPYLPNAIWIEPTNVCNLKCIMCPNSVVKNPHPGFMDLELFKKIVDEAKNFVSYTVLCISGESLLHPDFAAMADYAKKNGINTYLSTNATLLTPEISRKILGAELDWINFSFDGVTKEIYEKTRVNADFEKTLENIVNFLKIKKELNAKTQAELQIMIMDEKGREEYEKNQEAFFKKFKGLPLDGIQIRKPSTWGNFLAGTDKFVPEKLEKSRKPSPCSYLWSSLHILWDGRAVACTSDFFGDNVLGKFPEQSLKEIWNGDKMKKFRQAMIEGNFSEFNKNCGSCDSLWGQKILSLPAGIRGISAITVSNVLGRGFLIIARKIAKLLNPKFVMDARKAKK